MNIMQSSIEIDLKDGVDDSNNVFYFERTLDDIDGPIDPDFKPCGNTIAWKTVVPKTHYIVRVRTNDGGEIPHFHIVDINTEGKQFSSCVRIDKSAYFKHGRHQSILNTSERDALNSFLQMTPRHGNRTNWRRIVDEWNRSNSLRKIASSVQMPDYRLMTD